VRTIALHPADAATLLVGVELGGVMRSTDGGASWADHNPQAPRDAHEMATHPLAPDRVYEAAGDGVARSEDAGASWNHVEAGLDRGYAWATAVDRDDPDLWYVAVSTGPFVAHGRGGVQALGDILIREMQGVAVEQFGKIAHGTTSIIIQRR